MNTAVRVGYLTGLDALLKAQRTGLCRIMDLNFAEFTFRALG